MSNTITECKWFEYNVTTNSQPWWFNDSFPTEPTEWKDKDRVTRRTKSRTDSK